MPKHGRGDRQLRKNVLDVCVTTFWKLASACILLFVNEMSVCVDCLRSSTGFILAEKVLYLVWKKKSNFVIQNPTLICVTLTLWL